MVKILITGTAGFIGYHLAKSYFNSKKYEIIGYDCINDYYEISLKYARLLQSGIIKKDIIYGQKVKSEKFENYTFVKGRLQDKELLKKLFKREKFDYVVNLAAQAGVRYSLKDPDTYIQSNVIGFTNILECCRYHKVKHLVYASSSSVYGLNTKYPFDTKDSVDHPISLYAASKKSNELMAHTYSHLFGIPTTGLRFFTVYGPWGRPDMALFIFTKAILNNKPIDIFNNGEMQRDFTYIDDVIKGVNLLLNHIPKGQATNQLPDRGVAPYRVYNIGNNSPVKLMDFVKEIEKFLGKKAKKRYLPLQAGDVPTTFANVNDLINDIGYKPTTKLNKGIHEFVKWYEEYYLNN